jgi:hypothetical protein
MRKEARMRFPESGEPEKIEFIIFLAVPQGYRN